MNNKGFAISGIMYSVLIIFLVMITLMLFQLQNKKVILDELKLDTINAVESENNYEYLLEEISKLKRQIGTTDISNISDGTITGIITGKNLEVKDFSNSITGTGRVELNDVIFTATKKCIIQINAYSTPMLYKYGALTNVGSIEIVQRNSEGTLIRKNQNVTPINSYTGTVSSTTLTTIMLPGDYIQISSTIRVISEDTITNSYSGSYIVSNLE